MNAGVAASPGRAIALIADVGEDRVWDEFRDLRR